MQIKGNMEIVALSKNDIEELLTRAARTSVSLLRDDLEKHRTPELMTKSELANYLRCSVASISRFLKQGIPVEYVGESPRFRKVNIDKWLSLNASTGND